MPLSSARPSDALLYNERQDRLRRVITAAKGIFFSSNAKTTTLAL
jgi:hypothetical protein